MNLESKSWTKDLQQEEQASPLKCDKNKQSVKPSTGNEHTFKKKILEPVINKHLEHRNTEVQIIIQDYIILHM